MNRQNTYSSAKTGESLHILEHRSRQVHKIIQVHWEVLGGFHPNIDGGRLTCSKAKKDGGRNNILEQRNMQALVTSSHWKLEAKSYQLAVLHTVHVHAPFYKSSHDQHDIRLDQTYCCFHI